MWVGTVYIHLDNATSLLYRLLVHGQPYIIVYVNLTMLT